MKESARIIKSQLSCKEDDDYLIEGKVSRVIIVFAVPIILSNIIQQVYGMTDLMVIGRFGGNSGTVAVSTGTQITNFIILAGTALATAGQICTSQMAGAHENKKMERVIQTLIAMLVFLSIFLMIVLGFFYKDLILIMKCPSEAVEEAAAYLQISVFGIPFVIGYNIVCSILRGLGESKKPLYFTVTAAIINVFLDLILVIIFHMGVAGTAIATVAAECGAFLVSERLFMRKMQIMNINLQIKSIRIDRTVFVVILKLAIPSFVQYACIQVSQLWCNAQVNQFGIITSTANSIGMNLHQLTNLFMNGVSAAAAAMIGQNLGARKLDRVRQIIWYSVGYCLIITCIASIFCLGFPRYLYSLFTEDTAVQDYGVLYLRITVVAFFLASMLGPLQSLVTGAGYARLNFVIGILDGVVCRIGFSLLFVNVFHMGAVSYFWGSALARTFPVIICLIYYFSGRWKKRKLLL